MKLLRVVFTVVLLSTFSASLQAKDCNDYKKETVKFYKVLQRHIKLIKQLDRSSKSRSYKNKKMNVATDLVYLAIKKEKYEALFRYAKEKENKYCSRF